MPQPDLGSLVRPPCVSTELPADPAFIPLAAAPPTPVESAENEVVGTLITPSTVLVLHTLATAVEAAEMRAAAEAAPLLDPADAGRSTPGSGA